MIATIEASHLICGRKKVEKEGGGGGEGKKIHCVPKIVFFWLIWMGCGSSVAVDAAPSKSLAMRPSTPAHPAASTKLLREDTSSSFEISSRFVATGSGRVGVSERAAVEEASLSLRVALEGHRPSLLLVSWCGGSLNPRVLAVELQRVWGSTPIAGGSGFGFLSSEVAEVNEGLVLWAIHDPTGHYAVGHQWLDGENPRNSAAEAVRGSLKFGRGRPLEACWAVCHPHTHLDAVVAGIRDASGGRAAIAGYATGDGAEDEGWQIAGGKALKGSIVVALFFSSFSLTSSLLAGHTGSGGAQPPRLMSSQEASLPKEAAALARVVSVPGGSGAPVLFSQPAVGTGGAPPPQVFANVPPSSAGFRVDPPPSRPGGLSLSHGFIGAGVRMRSQETVRTPFALIGSNASLVCSPGGPCGAARGAAVVLVLCDGYSPKPLLAAPVAPLVAVAAASMVPESNKLSINAYPLSDVPAGCLAYAFFSMVEALSWARSASDAGARVALDYGTPRVQIDPADTTKVLHIRYPADAVVAEATRNGAQPGVCVVSTGAASQEVAAVLGESSLADGEGWRVLQKLL